MAKKKEAIDDDQFGLVFEEETGLVFEDAGPALVFEEEDQIHSDARAMLGRVRKTEPTEAEVEETVRGWNKFTKENSHYHGVNGNVVNAEFTAGCGHRERLMGSVTTAVHVASIRKLPCASCRHLEKNQNK